MSTKQWILYDENEANLCQELSLDEVNNNPATIEVVNPTDFFIESEMASSGKASSTLRLEIPANRFDLIAMAWCEKRQLHRELEK